LKADKEAKKQVISLDIFFIVLLFVLTLIFFWKLAFTGKIYSGYDPITYSYPNRLFAASSIRSGEVPLWNPYLFMGVPFVANIQTAVFYPLNVLFYLLPVTTAYNFSIILHIFLAGLFMYLFARFSLELKPFSSFISAVVFMFSGFFSAQVGHLEQINTSAWIPLLFLFIDKSFKKRSIPFAVCAGLVVGVVLLAGHPQEAYFTLVAATLYMLFNIVVNLRKGWQENITTISLFVLTIFLGFALAAVQLFPALELSRFALRSSMSYSEVTLWSLAPTQLFSAILPGFYSYPFCEFIGYLSIFSLFLALVAVVYTWREKLTLFFAGLAFLALFLAFGASNPLYHLMYRMVPGFSIFRVPARWLFIYTFSVAVLAGMGINFLLSTKNSKGDEGEENNDIKKAQPWRIFGFALIGLVTLVLSYCLFLQLLGHPVKFPETKTLFIWLVLAVASSILIIIVLMKRFKSPILVQLLVGLIIVVELFAASRGMEYNHPLPTSLYLSPPSSAQFLMQMQRKIKQPFRMLTLTQDNVGISDEQKVRRHLGKELTETEISSYLNYARFKEVLRPNISMNYKLASIDGYDGGIWILKQWIKFVNIFTQTQFNPILTVKDQLEPIPNTKLLGLLNVKYVVVNQPQPTYIDGVKYKLIKGLRVDSEEKLIKLENFGEFNCSSIGLISFLADSANISHGEKVAQLIITDAQGRQWKHDIRAGIDSSEWAYDRADVKKKVKHGKAKVALKWQMDKETPGYSYLTKMSFDQEIIPKEITIKYVNSKGTLYISGCSLIRGHRFAAVDLLSGRRGINVKPVFSGNVRIYENLDLLPRAFVVHEAKLFKNEKSILQQLTKSTFDPSRLVILRKQDIESSEISFPGVYSRNETPKILKYSPTQIKIDVRMNKRGLLVLSDSYFPGWKVAIDGKQGKILRANYMLRAVYLKAGKHRVTFFYQPNSFKYGLIISLLALAFAVGVIIIRYLF
jgi:hypothetical protein